MDASLFPFRRRVAFKGQIIFGCDRMFRRIQGSMQYRSQGDFRTAFRSSGCQFDIIVDICGCIAVVIIIVAHSHVIRAAGIRYVGQVA